MAFRKKTGARSVIVLAAALHSALAWAIGLGDISNGEHSFRQLGPDFSVEVPTAAVPKGTKVILFNKALAKRLGIEFPGEEDKLSKAVLETFGRMVGPDVPGAKKLIATRYQDSNDLRTSGPNSESACGTS